MPKRVKRQKRARRAKKGDGPTVPGNRVFRTARQRQKFNTVMDEFASGTLRSSSGSLVLNPKQAQAIAFSEARRRKT